MNVSRSKPVVRATTMAVIELALFDRVATTFIEVRYSIIRSWGWPLLYDVELLEQACHRENQRYAGQFSPQSLHRGSGSLP